jgi:arylsulfatase A-like enzyme
VWWAPMLPHGPFNPPERHRAPFRETAIPVPDTIVGDAREYQEAERTAYAMDAWLDEGLAALRAKLEQTGELEDTLFVFLIDNGYVNGAPSKGTVFEKGLRTPVFFTWPKGIHGGSTRPELVYSIDLYRTILEYAGVTPPETAGGASLKPLLDGKSEEWRDALYGAAYFYKDRPGQRRVENAVYALYARTERWKFVLYLRNLDPVNFLFFHEFADFPARQRGDRDLFDLQADPGERHNLAADSSHAELMDELQRGCLEWWKATGGGELELPGDEPQGPARKRGKNR